jgi:septum formation protein
MTSERGSGPGVTPPVAHSRIVLASGSPRRRQLFGLLGVAFDVLPSDIEEVPLPGEEPAAFALRAARDKVRDVVERRPGRIVLAADTVVEIEREILGKPTTADDAVRMLRRLSGRQHTVHTALALVASGECSVALDSATVHFVVLSEEMIRWYVATGEPMDKAGAYAIQGLGGVLVSAVEGSPHTVVGLPLHRMPELFAACGVDFWELISSRQR